MGGREDLIDTTVKTAETGTGRGIFASFYLFICQFLNPSEKADNFVRYSLDVEPAVTPYQSDYLFHKEISPHRSSIED